MREDGGATRVVGVAAVVEAGTLGVEVEVTMGSASAAVSPPSSWFSCMKG